MDTEKLFGMTNEERSQYLKDEVEKIIMSAPPEKRDRLRAVQNGIRMQVAATKTPMEAMIRLGELMWASVDKLTNACRELPK